MPKKRKRSQSRRPGLSLCRALVVYKKTYFMEVHEKNDERMLALIAQNHPSVAKVVQSHEDHLAALNTICSELRKRGVEVVEILRDSLETELRCHHYDLVVTVGGDGTVLDVSHYIKGRLPVLGVNSATVTSHGHYCLATAETFAAIVDEIISGQRQPANIMRLKLTLDGKPLNELVLNEVLITHAEIGETSRYTVEVNGQVEEQKSDGIFFGPPSGSTGWMKSYGCRVLPALSRQFQFVVRGLITFPGSTYRYANGLLAARECATVMSLMPDGQLLLDGRHIKYSFPRGSELKITAARQQLRLFVESTVNDRYTTAQAVTAGA